MKTLGTRWYALLLGLPVFLFVFAVSVLAVGKPETAGKPSSRPEQAQAHLTEGKLRACQAKENSIKTRAQHLGELAAKMQEKFDAIAARVKEHYTSSGKTVANYDALVANIAVKKTAVAAALAKAQSGAVAFSCTGNDPKTQMTQYRKDMQDVIKALKDYRTSIKDLIVAVKSITGATQRANPSNSPHPTGKGQNK